MVRQLGRWWLWWVIGLSFFFLFTPKEGSYYCSLREAMALQDWYYGAHAPNFLFFFFWKKGGVVWGAYMRKFVYYWYTVLLTYLQTIEYDLIKGCYWKLIRGYWGLFHNFMKDMLSYYIFICFLEPINKQNFVEYILRKTIWWNILNYALLHLFWFWPKSYR